MNLRFLLPILILCAAPVLSFAKDKKSSEIPDRREFPLNPAINPCVNFYDHVCSKVIDSFQLREDRSAHTFAFSDSAERLLLKKKDYFKSLIKRKVKTPREETLKNYYLACMDQKDGARDEKAEVKRIKDIMANLKTREDVLSWVQKTYLSTEIGLLSWDSINNMDKPTKNDLYVLSEAMTLPEKSYYKKEDTMADFKMLAADFYKTIGEKDAAAKAAVLLKFESSLAEVHPVPDKLRQVINDRVFLDHAKLKADYPALGLDDLIKELPNDILIRDLTPEDFKYLNDFLANGDLQDIKTVLIYQSLHGLMDDAYPQYYQKKFDFSKKHLGGPNQRPDRQERCTKSVMSIFGKELDSILLPEMFPNFPKEKVISMAEKMRGALLKSLADNTWLSRSAKKEAIEKVTKAKLFLVAPENDKQWDFLPEATYFPKEPMKNSKTVSEVRRKKTLKELREEQDPTIWGMSPLTVNAYYSPPFNKFVLPIGILQYPFFDPKMSDEENLAAVGTVVGHEVGHGIDDQGARYDSDGKQRQWRSDKDVIEFNKRTALLIEQFDGAGHNGKLTLGENIGDLVGVTTSLKAANEDPAFHNSPERKKAYFVAYARLWCEVKRPKAIENQLKTNPHSLGVARVNQQIRQQPEFKEVFQCRDTDPMVLPEDKLVHIW